MNAHPTKFCWVAIYGDLVNHRTLSILMRFPLRNPDARL